MKELKQYIDRVLGNNIRCLLPSYWWKRIFGLVIDEVDGKASKESVANLKKKIENFKGGGIQAITIYPLDRSTKQSYHRQVYDTLVELAAKGEDFIVYAEVGIGIFPATMIVANSLLDTPHYIFDFRGWEQIENHGYTKTEKEHYTVALFADGTMQLDTTQDYVIDHVISETSTNAVQNKVVTAAINDKADKTDIKTLNGVSLLGGGNLQLGDGETIVYDDTEVRETIDNIYDDIDYIYSEIDNIVDSYDEEIYEAEANALNAAYELKVTEGYSLKGSTEFKDFLDKTFLDQYSYYVITDVESEDGTDDWEIILRSWSQNPTEYPIKKTDLPYSIPSAGFVTIGSYYTTNVKDFKVYHPLIYENKKLRELTTSLESRIAALEGNQTA